MIVITNIPFMRKRKARIAPPAPLALTAGTYQVSTSITLSFDRAIDITLIDVTKFFLNDGLSSHHQLQGTGSATLIDANTVRIGLIDIGRATGHGAILTALIDNGIVATIDGSAWGGVDELELPWP